MKRAVAFFLLILVAGIAGAAPIRVTIQNATQVVLFSGDVPPADTDGKGSPITSPATLGDDKQKGSTAFFVAQDGRVVARTWQALATDPVVDMDRPTHLNRVMVRARNGDADLAGVVIELKDADRTQRNKESERSDARSTFTFVRIGPATITGRLRREDNKVEERVQKITVSEKEPPEYILLFGETPKGGFNASNAPANTVPPGQTGAGFGSNLLSLLLGLAVVAGVAYALWSFARRNPDRVQRLLGKIGADVPEAPAAAPDPVLGEPAPPDPPAQILLDPAAPINLPAPASVASTGTPALIAADGSPFEIPEGETLVGREALGGLMIAHESISRRHARLIRSAGEITVEDLGSTNGTFLDGRRLTAPDRVSPGQTVRFGTVDYQFRN